MRMRSPPGHCRDDEAPLSRAAGGTLARDVGRPPHRSLVGTQSRETRASFRKDHDTVPSADHGPIPSADHGPDDSLTSMPTCLNQRLSGSTPTKTCACMPMLAAASTFETRSSTNAI